MAGDIVQISGSEFQRRVLQSEAVVLVMFTGDGCVPCKTLEPTLSQVGAEYGDELRIMTVDVDDAPELAQAYNIQSVPTLIMFAQGGLRGRLHGFLRTRSIIDHFVETHLGPAQ